MNALELPRTMTIGQVARKADRNRRTVLRKCLLINARVDGELLRNGPRVGTRPSFLVDVFVLLREWPDVFPSRAASTIDLDDIRNEFAVMREEIAILRRALRDTAADVRSLRHRLRGVQARGQMGTLAAPL